MNDRESTKNILGAHFSIARGLHDAVYKAKSYACDALQMFTKNATSWRERDITEKERQQFENVKQETGIHRIASHASYLINLASPEGKKHAMSVRSLRQEIIRSAKLNIPYVILHPGAHMDSGVDTGIRKIADSINRIFADTETTSTRLLLETTAGQGSSIGHTFEQLAQIVELINDRHRIGICLDTCHIFAGGYDIRSEDTYNQTMDSFDRILGLVQLYIIHFNDSKKDLGSRVDRHAHIGQGFIGVSAFQYFLKDERLLHIPKLLETPKGDDDEDWDRRNLEILRTLI